MSRDTQRVLLCANTAWSLFNFRRGVIVSLLRAGHEVHTVAPDDVCSAHLRTLGCTVHSINVEAKGTNPIRDLQFLWSLFRLYQKIQPSVIFHYTIKPNIYGSIASWLAKIPSISVTTGLGYVFINSGLTTAIVRRLYKAAFRYPQENWFLNADDLETFTSYKLVSHRTCRLLPGEGIDLQYFSPASWHFGPRTVRTDGHGSEIIFLMIARVLWDKGVGEYVEAARILKERYPSLRIQLLGPAGVENPSAVPLESIRRWQTQGLIEYLGVTDDVRPAIANAHCIVLPSYREGLPRALLEASAMERPVIAANVTGCRDVVEHERTGLLCQVRNPQDLAQKMERIILMGPAQLKKMGTAGRAKMAREFDETLVISEYFRILHTLA